MKRHTTVQNIYSHGSIVKIKLETFLTYDSVEFRPGPCLNVIIGPNGTGKSTIVCAICLGLAGKTALLGRALQPTDYIKHGSVKATIEIELCNDDGENYSITREIFKNNTSHWSINHRNSSQKGVEELVAKFNIQVGNLCQFLPQDKVADFAKMSQQELLENTQKAVGPPEMYQNHCRLKTARDEERQLENAAAATKEHHKQEVTLNARLEQDVKNYTERKKHLERVNTLKMKRPWVEYEDMRKAFTVEKESKEKLAVRVQEERAINAPLQAKLTKAQKQGAELDGKAKSLSEQNRNAAKHAAERSKSIEHEDERLMEISEELAQRRQEETTRRRKLKDLLEIIKGLNAELEGIESADVQPQMDELFTQQRRVQQELAQLENNAEEVRNLVNATKREVTEHQNELQQFQDMSNLRLQDLRRTHRDTHSAVVWLRANQHRFKAPIHEPMMLVINVTDPRHAKYVENHINFNDLRAFVCEDADDASLFLSLLREEQNLRINTVTMPPQPASSFRPQYPISKYRRYGFHSYIGELFECPEAVLRFLCVKYRVYMIPVGNEDSKRQMEQIQRSCPELTQFYTENHSCSLRKSKYSSAVSSRSTELRKPHLLAQQFDRNREGALQEQIKMVQDKQRTHETNYRRLQDEHRTLSDTATTMKNTRKELMEKKNLKRTLMQKIQMKQDTVKRIEGEAINLEEETGASTKKGRQIQMRKVKLIGEQRDFTQSCLNLSKEHVMISLQYTMAQAQSQAIDHEINERSQTLQNLEREFEAKKDHLKRVKETAVKLLAVAKRETNTDPKEELSPLLHRAFETCPSSLEEIDSAIHEEQARADCRFQTDESVVQEYESRKRRIIKLSAEAEQKTQSLARHRSEIDRIKADWLDPLSQLIRKINDNFAMFMQELKCAGEVDLNIPPNPEDYEKYGVRIKVKYRDSEQLRELTPHHQSGGERSVATVLYMMALQELTKVPFRTVDEINQGMDPQNERKVFELVVKTACRENTSQYFLLTPKLLPDLQYTDNMTVLCIYNGQSMINHTEWSLKKCLRRRARLMDD